jgi:hypothetical protein
MIKSMIGAVRTGALIAGVLTLSACADLNHTQQRMLSGAAIGTGVGVVGTVMTGGCVSCGAVIGGVAGAGVGYLHDTKHHK